MKKQPVDTLDNENEGRAQKVMEDLIGAQVMHNLGKPGGFREVQVRRLWENHFRVNLIVGDAVSARFAHSYFLVIDDDGLIVTSTPKITKQY